MQFVCGHRFDASGIPDVFINISRPEGGAFAPREIGQVILCPACRRKYVDEVMKMPLPPLTGTFRELAKTIRWEKICQLIMMMDGAEQRHHMTTFGFHNPSVIKRIIQEEIAYRLTDRSWIDILFTPKEPLGTRYHQGHPVFATEFFGYYENLDAFLSKEQVEHGMLYALPTHSMVVLVTHAERDTVFKRLDALEIDPMHCCVTPCRQRGKEAYLLSFRPEVADATVIKLVTQLDGHYPTHGWWSWRKMVLHTRRFAEIVGDACDITLTNGATITPDFFCKETETDLVPLQIPLELPHSYTNMRPAKFEKNIALLRDTLAQCGAPRSRYTINIMRTLVKPTGSKYDDLVVGKPSGFLFAADPEINIEAALQKAITIMAETA